MEETAAGHTFAVLSIIPRINHIIHSTRTGASRFVVTTNLTLSSTFCPVIWITTNSCVVDRQAVLTISLVFRGFLPEVLCEQSCVAAPGLAPLRQLVKQLHCPGVYFVARHRLVSKHWAEPAVNLSKVIKSNGEQDIEWQSRQFNHSLSSASLKKKKNTGHYLVDLFTHAVYKKQRNRWTCLSTNVTN